MQTNLDNSTATVQEKRRQLYDRQVELLNTFLKRGAITQAQYNKSYGDLTEKMGYGKKDK